MTIRATINVVRKYGISGAFALEGPAVHWLRALQHIRERGELALEVPPLSDRGGIQSLADLYGARRRDGAAPLLKSKTRIFPLQSTMSDDSSAHRLLVFDQIFVLHDEKPMS